MPSDSAEAITARARELYELAASLAPALSAALDELDELARSDRAHVAAVFARLLRAGGPAL